MKRGRLYLSCDRWKQLRNLKTVYNVCACIFAEAKNDLLHLELFLWEKITNDLTTQCAASDRIAYWTSSMKYAQSFRFTNFPSETESLRSLSRGLAKTFILQIKVERHRRSRGSMETPLGLGALLSALLELSFLQSHFSLVYFCELLNRLGSCLVA